MSAELPVGYIYRVANASAERLRAIVAAIVGAAVGAGFTFGGAAQWDFDPAKKQDNLRPIEAIPDDRPLVVSGDFGHAFSVCAEVRWKRRDDGEYDVLILSETEQSIVDAVPLRIGEQPWRTRRYDEAALVQTGDYSAICYVDYLAPNGAVQFQRLVVR